MKAIASVLLLFACIISLHADILVNGNFADGRAHWKGDARDPDTTTGDLTLANQVNRGGVTITLKKDKWTKIYQNFATREKKLHYAITFTLSSDYRPDRSQTQDSGFAPTPGLDDIEGLPIYYAMNGGEWMCILEQAGMGSSSFPISPDVKKADSQTLSGNLRGATGDETVDMLIVFAFPPGEGSITITNVSLTSGSDN